ncbi:AMP-dependent synthetase [Erwinia sp. OLTSP20]|uniref:class I adenylate-forming enzyme family protein n=1 Tax=unclassified Erwinia TaxID=2622719 RepID=UPI000C17F6A1|nr:MULTISPECIES: class I adenylate-forming enzyme family protein [unclassified Erwinia]PIJ48503.1 AMP-dependent synthetase [Erwinia sp. OAMSP11]PIJ66802.1 AMP-dependent synthetase [Erwinia sp. OLSSP12]PIJ78776.1 AMP-dependent synthetase [Erwinia sp. OLCASP19]PIJ80121.1 AMP-dependent synthetase [Erwinia sp. OLMTSP26]PIJ82190.1 AMP-dependent synthetase [Erwinia sp. OLMDSP33]
MNQTLRNLGDLIDRSLPQSRIAIIDLRDAGQPREYTHQQIDELAGGVAHYLQARGYRRGDAIAIASLNRAEYIAAYFGIMRAGLVAVPLNIKVPAETLHYFLDDADIKLAFVDNARAELIGDSVTTINFDDDSSAGFVQQISPCTFDSVAPAAGELAMILYTSGSTGRPKGVPLTHAGQYWALDATRFAGVEPDAAQARYIVAQPLFHMNGLFLVKRVFAANGLLVVLPSFTIESYLHALSYYRINIVTAVPTMFARLLRDPDISRYDFSQLQKVMLGSAPITAGLLNRIKAAFPDVTISHGYGTTEAGPAVFGPHTDGLPVPPLSLGYPLASGEVKFAEGASADQGVLMMRNPAVTPGYHRLPEKSAAVLRDGWYYSGDVMRRDENGFYFFVGRADDMFVCSGENIYPGEVEKLLESHPAVRQTCVVPLDDEERGQIPVAFVVLQQGQSTSQDALKQHALTHGPAYQHPRRIAFVNELPWAATNKVDRQQLRQLALTLEQQQRWDDALAEPLHS